MTDSITISGGWQLIGQYVAIVIAGLDCGTYQLDKFGEATVPYGSDPDGLLSPNYLNSVSDSTSTNPALVSFDITNGSDETITVYVPVLIGYAYTSTGKLMRPILESQAKDPQGTSLGKKRRIFDIAVLFTNAQGVSFGTNDSTANTNMQDANFYDNRNVAYTKDHLFTGVYWGSINDSDSYDGQLIWKITRPYPCVINAISVFINTSEG